MVAGTVTLERTVSLRCHRCLRLLGRLSVANPMPDQLPASVTTTCGTADYRLNIVCPDSRCHCANTFNVTSLAASTQRGGAIGTL